MENNEQVSNLGYLQELSKGNEQFVKDMVKIFLDENPGEISLLEKGIAENDFELVRSSAHKLRSTAPFVGVDRVIEEEITELEKLATQKSKENQNSKDALGGQVAARMKNLFARIKEVFTLACLELRSYAL
jgi:HPt (histidine-containing phosphotransfer) domain-containing protein